MFRPTADLIVSFACDAGRKLAPGKAEERWDECPAVSDDFDVAWDFITGRVETLVARLSVKSPNSALNEKQEPLS
jgi:hypothetical protein